MVARHDLRPVALVGDGAFQMTGMELSNIVRRNYSPTLQRLARRLGPRI